ncbi:MAG: histidine kinase, partial [Bacteroidaceae bacterium]|nr:histidine kinase [Bacteroidaceae bacterium]
MDTTLRSKSFQKNLFLSIGSIFLLFAACFSFYQYQREKDYKVDILHSRLQMFNYEVMQSINDTTKVELAVDDYIQSMNIKGLRITVLDTRGQVLQDSYQSDVTSLENHLERPEIQMALSQGNGFDKRRHSESTKETYFYSATLFKDTKLPNSPTQGIIIRSAIPYSAELTESLKADNTYIYFTIALTLSLGVVLYLNTRRISRHIRYLREFAVKAEQGEELDHELERRLPDDELGEISHTIITLYWKLRHSEEDKERFKRQLTQNAAHELKTPNASIHGFLESILDNPDMPQEKRQHFLERCFAQSERMSKLLSDMSQLAQLEDTASEPARSDGNTERKQTDVVPIIHNVIEDTLLQLQEKGLQVELDLPKTICLSSPLAEPEESFYSLFRNLFDNSIAYATNATKIMLSYHQREFTFADNGVGV